MELKKAQNAGEIRLSLELVTGTIGESAPTEVLRAMVDQFMEHLKTTDTGKLWQIVKVEGKYEAWKGGETARYTPELS
jgi:hypothetical protein